MKWVARAGKKSLLKAKLWGGPGFVSRKLPAGTRTRGRYYCRKPPRLGQSWTFPQFWPNRSAGEFVSLRGCHGSMGTSRKVTETQLDKAKAALAARVAALKAKGVDAKGLKNDPKWRLLDGKVRQIAGRIRKIAELEAVEADLAQHRIERQAQLAAKKAEKKAGVKKVKEDKKPKAKAKSEPKGPPAAPKGGKK